MKAKLLPGILDLAVHFAKSNKDILALGLCGSWARGTAREDSDIDLSLLVTDKNRFKKTDWLTRIPFERINEKIAFYKDKAYGKAWSRHVVLESKAKIEFSFADPSWADVRDLDAGTQKVVAEGYRILYDPQQILHRLVEKVKTTRS